MKSIHSIPTLLLSVLLFSCTGDLTDIGTSIQPTSDRISVYAETFYPVSENYFIDSFTSRPDSFLLGTYYDKKFGTTHADIFAQVQPPLNFSFPKGAVADSAHVLIYYSSWYGDKYSPMEVSIYEMNKATFEYTKPYRSDIKVEDYTDLSLLLRKRIFTARDAVILRNDSSKVIFKLNDDFVKRFSTILTKKFSNNSEFLNFFKGLYITTDFGSASMLYINQIDLKYFFHYKYANAGDTDSTTVNTYVTFPANTEVRQVNRIFHPDKDAIKTQMQSRTEVTFVSSPANVYTRVKIPLKYIQTKMNTGGKKLYINRAQVRFYVEDLAEDTIDHKLVKNLMIIKESAFNRFFSKRELPSDSCAIIGTFGSETNAETNSYDYFYSFNLATLLTTEFRNSTLNQTLLPDSLNLLLVPVSVSYNSSSTIAEVKQQNLMNAVTLSSHKHLIRPIRLNTVFSGF